MIFKYEFRSLRTGLVLTFRCACWS